MRTSPAIYKVTDQDDLMISNHEEGTAQVKEQSAPEIMLVLSIYLFLKEKQERKQGTRDFCLRISEMSKALISIEEKLISHQVLQRS